MSHLVACELSDRFAAIAAVGGTNQIAAVQGCAPGPEWRQSGQIRWPATGQVSRA